ncbi:MAG: tetratricopeptide repeat protein [Gallionellaceae bacterium]
MKARFLVKQLVRRGSNGLHIVSHTDHKAVIADLRDPLAGMNALRGDDLPGESINDTHQPFSQPKNYMRMKGMLLDASQQDPWLTIEQTLQQASSLSQTGEGLDAEQLYQSMLQVDLGMPEERYVISYSKEPTHHEIDRLLALYHEGNHAEMGFLAHSLIERYPHSGVAWKALAGALQAQGKNALAALKKALVLLPDDADVHADLGSVQQSLGQFENAVLSFNNALKINPNFADALNNMGNAQQCLGQLDNAVASYLKALEINVDFAEAHNNLGNARHDLGQLDNAVASYRRAIEIVPDYAEAHNNLGNAFYDLEQLAAAEANYRQALLIKPHYVDALNNLALLLIAQDKSAMALHAIKQSLRINETVAAKKIFAACIKHLLFTQDDKESKSLMLRALSEPWGKPNELAQSCINFVKLNPGIEQYVARANESWPVRLSALELFGTAGLDAPLSDPLLCRLLESTPICDTEMERFLTMARYALLEVAIKMKGSESQSGTDLSFYSALAQQCFINEYVFPYTDAEILTASNLQGTLAVSMKANHPLSPLRLLALASYYPLYSLPFAKQLLDRQWPDQVSTVIKQQLLEPAEELQLCATIPQISDIEDDVSLLVQRQYEEHPYPRWIKTAPAATSKNIVGYLSQKFPLATFNRHQQNSSTEFLIAGCGTGQHSIETSQQFQCGKVLAIDLSRSSLAYAKRKSQEMGIAVIEYAQADLLKLASLSRSFDVIESSGVLHHLGDPWDGWRVLISSLRSKGFMKLGLYSEIARQNIVKARALISERGYGSSSNEIRRCRQELVAMENATDLGGIIKSSDFFSISTCRDLLFHVQEHHMTLLAIDAFLRESNLLFVGFEIEGSILHAYRQRFPDDRSATNLAQWHQFEIENPNTFANMYQFWVQKN